MSIYYSFVEDNYSFALVKFEQNTLDTKRDRKLQFALINSLLLHTEHIFREIPRHIPQPSIISCPILKNFATFYQTAPHSITFHFLAFSDSFYDFLQLATTFHGYFWPRLTTFHHIPKRSTTFFHFLPHSGKF